MGAAKSGSLDRNRIKERRESFISYSKEELFQNDSGTEKTNQNQSDVEKIEDLSVEKEEENRSKSETRDSDKSDSGTKKPEIKQYNSKTLPKRIATIKKNRAKTLKETAKFYMDVNDEPDTILKIVEPQDREEQENALNENLEGQKQEKKKDSEIISQLVLQNPELQRKLSKPTIVRRKSMDAPEKPTIKLEKPSSELPVIPPLPPKEKKMEVQESEPIYESLLRNVHVPYKFAPPMLRRSSSIQSSTSEKLKLSIPLAASTPSIKQDSVDPDDGSDCDYVTLTYNDNDLVAVDGEEVKRSPNSTPSTPPSAQISRINQEIMMMSSSDFNINYQESQRNSREELEFFSSTNDLERFEGKPKSLIHRFVGLRINEPQNEETLSQKSISTMASRKSLDSGVFKPNLEFAHIYRQGSEDLGSRIAHVDYADPKTLFPSPANILINKAALKSQRDSVFSSSSDSVCENQKLQLEDSYYEQSVEDCLENDFRDSAVYSDDNGKLDLSATSEGQETMKGEHIYAQVVKKAKVPPLIPKKPSLLVKPTILSPPPVPIKPSSLQSPEIKKVIFNYRNSSNLPVNISRTSKSPPISTPDGESPKSWVSKQVEKFQ